MKSRLFDALPENLDALSTEELEGLIQARQDIVRRIAENDVELIPAEKFSASDLVDEMTFAVEQIETIRAEKAIRTEAEGTFSETVADLAGKAGVTSSRPRTETTTRQTPTPAMEPTTTPTPATTRTPQTPTRTPIPPSQTTPRPRPWSRPSRCAGRSRGRRRRRTPSRSRRPTTPTVGLSWSPRQASTESAPATN